MKHNDFSMLLTTFLSKYLPGQRNLSRNTISSYRDCFKLFLQFCSEEKKIKIETIQLHDMKRKNIMAFCDWLEKGRNCSISTRNQRLAAFKSFSHFIAAEDPEHLFQCQQIAAIPMKKKKSREMNYFSPEGMNKLLQQPDTRTWKGRRNHALLVLLYDCGLRVQELADLKIGDVRLENPAIVTILGKGRKYRIIPINQKTAKIITDYLNELTKRYSFNLDSPLFQNNQHTKLTRVGLSGILQKYVEKMKSKGLDKFIPGSVSPHCLRQYVEYRNMGNDNHFLMYYIYLFLEHSPFCLFQHNLVNQSIKSLSFSHFGKLLGRWFEYVDSKAMRFFSMSALAYTSVVLT